jgi:O-antigen chain-terminating methyltransferase
MVSLYKELGVTATTEDAIKYLCTVTPEFILIVSRFHIAEHLPFELLLDIIKKAYRTLLPGGFLILETPNPENALVGSMNFYMDPTHRELNALKNELISVYKSRSFRITAPLRAVFSWMRVCAAR